MEDLIQELSVLAQSRRSAQAKIAEADAEKEIASNSKTLWHVRQF